MTTFTTPDLALRDHLTAHFGNAVFADLTRVSAFFGTSRSAIAVRIRRGTLPVRTVQPGGKTAPILVLVDDIWAVCGQTRETPSLSQA